MKNSINGLKSLLTKSEIISNQSLSEIKGGGKLGTIVDPRRPIGTDSLVILAKI